MERATARMVVGPRQRVKPPAPTRPAASGLRARQRLDHRERRAGRIDQRADAADLGDVLRVHRDRRAQLAGARDRGVDVGDRDIGQPVGLAALLQQRRHAGAVDAVAAEHVVHLVGSHVHRLVRVADDLFIEGDRLGRVAGVQLVPDPAAVRGDAVGRVAAVALEQAQLRALRIGDARGAPYRRDVERLVDDAAVVGGHVLRGRVDVLDRQIRDPVRGLVAARRTVTTDHGVEAVAEADHVVVARPHRERQGLPAEHLAIKRLGLLGVLGNVLEPDELPGDWLEIGHGHLSFRP